MQCAQVLTSAETNEWAGLEFCIICHVTYIIIAKIGIVCRKCYPSQLKKGCRSVIGFTYYVPKLQDQLQTFKLEQNIFKQSSYKGIVTGIMKCCWQKKQVALTWLDNFSKAAPCSHVVINWYVHIYINHWYTVHICL